MVSRQQRSATRPTDGNRIRPPLLLRRRFPRCEMVSWFCRGTTHSDSCVVTAVCIVRHCAAGADQLGDAFAATPWATGTSTVAPCGFTAARPLGTEPDRSRDLTGAAGSELIC